MENKKKFKRPFFSIVIPTYNRAQDLQFALFCIFQQTFKDFEIVISDNCSNDNTKEIVDKFKSEKIRYFKNKSTIKMISNQRKAVEYATGKYVFTHSDDDFLLYKSTLEEVYEKIIKYKPGYLRINYVSLSLDKKKIFNYKVHKPFKKDLYLKPFLSNKEIIKFIVDSDPYFITGIIFKNELPSRIKVIDADPNPWIEILFHVIKELGAYFIIKPKIIAYWSRRKIKRNQDHHFYSMTNGKLKSENYLNVVKKKLKEEDYEIFLHNELLLIYIGLLPAIKLYSGNKTMLQIFSRLCELDKNIKKNISYRIQLYLLIFFPRSILKIIRDIYLLLYMRLSSVKDEKEILSRINAIYEKYNAFSSV